MVVLVHRLERIYFKLENHFHHHQQDGSEALQASLDSYRAKVKENLKRLKPNSKPGLEFLSFGWIHECFEVIEIVNQAFAKLVVEIDCPGSNWEDESVEVYMSYSLGLMEFCNLISSSLSHLGQSRILISHAVSLLEEDSVSVAVQKLRATERTTSILKKIEDKRSSIGCDEMKFSSMKSRVVYEALMDLKRVGFWICEVILAGVSGDVDGLRKGFSNPGLGDLNLIIDEAKLEEKGVDLKEVREVNDSANRLADVLEAGEDGDQVTEELKKRLIQLENMIDKFKNEVDQLFTKLLVSRNELVNSFRRKV